MPTVKHLFAVIVLVAAAAGTSRAENDPPPMKLVGDAPSASERQMPSAAELRQARALERYRQRQARLEADAWAGYSPLRPTISSNPYVQLRTPPVRPFYIWSAWDLVPR